MLAYNTCDKISFHTNPEKKFLYNHVKDINIGTPFRIISQPCAYHVVDTIKGFEFASTLSFSGSGISPEETVRRYVFVICLETDRKEMYMDIDEQSFRLLSNMLKIAFDNSLIDKLYSTIFSAGYFTLNDLHEVINIVPIRFTDAQMRIPSYIENKIFLNYKETIVEYINPTEKVEVNTSTELHGW